jgi:hypothetical protein
MQNHGIKGCIDLQKRYRPEIPLRIGTGWGLGKNQGIGSVPRNEGPSTCSRTYIAELDLDSAPIKQHADE